MGKEDAGRTSQRARAGLLLFLRLVLLDLDDQGTFVHGLWKMSEHGVSRLLFNPLE